MNVFLKQRFAASLPSPKKNKPQWGFFFFLKKKKKKKKKTCALTMNGQ
jgi:hypothetical protein